MKTKKGYFIRLNQRGVICNIVRVGDLIEEYTGRGWKRAIVVGYTPQQTLGGSIGGLKIATLREGEKGVAIQLSCKNIKKRIRIVKSPLAPVKTVEGLKEALKEFIKIPIET